MCSICRSIQKECEAVIRVVRSWRVLVWKRVQFVKQHQGHLKSLFFTSGNSFVLHSLMHFLTFTELCWASSAQQLTSKSGQMCGAKEVILCLFKNVTRCSELRPLDGLIFTLMTYFMLKYPTVIKADAHFGGYLDNRSWKDSLYLNTLPGAMIDWVELNVLSAR